MRWILDLFRRRPRLRHVQAAAVPTSLFCLSAGVLDAFHQLGIADQKLPELLEGNAISFFLADIAEGTRCIAQVVSTSRLLVGIDTIDRPGCGLQEMMVFESRAEAAARAVGAEELEIVGVEIQNERLRAALAVGGFRPTVVSIPADMGGGTAEAVSRISRVS